MSTTDSATPRRARPRLVAAIVVAAAAAAAALIAVGNANAGTAPAAGTTAPPPSATYDSSPPGTPGTSPFPPAAPTNLVATDITSHSVTLTWTASTAGCCPITGYDINVYQPFTDVVPPQGRVGNVTTLVYNLLSPTAQYSFSVSAVDSLGHISASSNKVTLTAPVADEGDTVPPSAPTNLTITGATLNWQPSTDNVGVTGYRVYRFDQWYTNVLVATVTGTSYTVTATSPPGPSGRPWVYYVRAIDAAGNVSVATDIGPGASQPPIIISPSASPTPRSTCAVTYTNTAQWPHGFSADVRIANTGTTQVNGWNLRFSFGGDQHITSASGATYSQIGAAAILGSTNHDAVIQPGGTVPVRITGTWHNSNAAPASFLLNSAPCTTG